jgi:hypothetical protein
VERKEGRLGGIMGGCIFCGDDGLTRMCGGRKQSKQISNKRNQTRHTDWPQRNKCQQYCNYSNNHTTISVLVFSTAVGSVSSFNKFITTPKKECCFLTRINCNGKWVYLNNQWLDWQRIRDKSIPMARIFSNTAGQSLFLQHLRSNAYTKKHKGDHSTLMDGIFLFVV